MMKTYRAALYRLRGLAIACDWCRAEIIGTQTAYAGADHVVCQACARRMARGGLARVAHRRTVDMPGRDE